MDQKTQDLFNFYGSENKNDFYSSYLYMKFLHHYVSKALQNTGVPLNPNLEEIDPSIDEMVQAAVGINRALGYVKPVE